MNKPRRWFYALVLSMALFLTACVPNNSMPNYVVKLTDPFMYLRKACTGVLIDSTHAATAGHCLGVVRVVDQSGHERYARAVKIWNEYDLLLLEFDPPLVKTEYAEFAAAAPGTVGMFYGDCPYFFTHTPRTFLAGPHQEEVWINDQKVYFGQQVWYGLGRQSDAVCPGDSGGVVIVDGQVAGFLSNLDNMLVPWGAWGTNAYTLRAEEAIRLMYETEATADAQ